MVLLAYIQILRLNHWFKNLFIYFGAFTAYLASPVSKEGMFWKLLLAFLLASVVSSVNYAINQITDKKFDALHPLKKTRPLPLGIVSVEGVLVLAIVLLFLSLLVSLNYFSIWFSVALMTLWFAGIVYNVPPIRAKDRPYFDVLIESANNPIRFLIGWFVINQSWQLPWVLVAATWSAGAILMTAKRYGELTSYGKQLTPYRNTFATYSTKGLQKMLHLYTLVTVVFLTLSFWPLVTLSVFVIPPITLFLIWFAKVVGDKSLDSKNPEGLVLRPRVLIYLIVALLPLFIYLTLL